MRYGAFIRKNSYNLSGDPTRRGDMDVDGRIKSKWFL
jgi:hypothetical protein